MSYVNLPGKCFPAGEVMDDYLLVRLSAGKIVKNDADHAPLGAIDVPALEVDQPLNVQLLNKQGTLEIQAVCAVDVDQMVVAAAGGKVSADPATGTRYVVGKSLTAVTDGGVIEVIPYGYGHTLTAE